MGARELGWLSRPALTIWGHLPDNPDTLWEPFSALATLLLWGTGGQRETEALPAIPAATLS